MKCIDLHIHSNYSDGKKDIEYILNKAEKTGLSVISITDHNTAAAYPEIKEKRHLFSGKILTGIEAGTSWQGEGIELLGYGIDTDKIQRLVNEIMPTQTERHIAELIINAKAMVKAGVILDSEYLEMVEKDPTILVSQKIGLRGGLLQQIKKHPENEKFFKEGFDGITVGIFMRQYLSNPKSLLYADKSATIPDFETVANMLKEAGGLVFLAHAFLYSEKIIKDLDKISQYVDGIECCYGTFSQSQIDFLCDFCDKNGLYKSGGSDFHDEILRSENVMGYSDGKKIDYSVIQHWAEKITFI